MSSHKGKALKKTKDEPYGKWGNRYGMVNKITEKQQRKSERRYSDIQAGRVK